MAKKQDSIHTRLSRAYLALAIGFLVLAVTHGHRVVICINEFG